MIWTDVSHGNPSQNRIMSNWWASMRKEIEMNINKGLKWIAVSIAVCFAIYITKSANCLWAFMFPLIVD